MQSDYRRKLRDYSQSDLMAERAYQQRVRDFSRLESVEAEIAERKDLRS